MTIEGLRQRLADELGDVSQRKADLASIKTEREQHGRIVGELEGRETDLKARIAELERESTDLAQRLRMRERDYAERTGELEKARQALGDDDASDIGEQPLSGDYAQDTGQLLTALAIERKRAALLETRTRALLEKLESAPKRSSDANAAIAELRRALAARDEAAVAYDADLANAEARLASAETQLNELLKETAPVPEEPGNAVQQLLAEKLSSEEKTEKLKDKVLGIESVILAGWGTAAAEPESLRERLAAIASDVSRIVYAMDEDVAEEPAREESLFERVQRFAAESDEAETLPPPPPARTKPRNGRVSSRMAAVRDIQSRG
jgi:DNA repair exonuclease SbcCD ATPase subunit